MAKKWNERSLPQKVASTAVWMLVLPAVVVVQLVRNGKASMRAKK